jgi:hypothetical protein
MPLRAAIPNNEIRLCRWNFLYTLFILKLHAPSVENGVNSLSDVREQLVSHDIDCKLMTVTDSNDGRLDKHMSDLQKQSVCTCS